MLFTVCRRTDNPHAPTTKQTRAQPPSLVSTISPKTVSDIKFSIAIPTATLLPYEDGAVEFRRIFAGVGQLPSSLTLGQATAKKPAHCCRNYSRQISRPSEAVTPPSPWEKHSHSSAQWLKTVLLRRTVCDSESLRAPVLTFDICLR